MNAPSHRPIDYRRYFPWTQLFRAIRISLDPRKLVLAAAALVTFWCGDALISLLPFAPQSEALPTPPWNATSATVLIEPTGEAGNLWNDPAAHGKRLVTRLVAPLAPLVQVVSLPFGEPRSWSEIAYRWTRLLWALAVWSIFGGAIARLAAVEFARDERGGLRKTLEFAVRRFVAFFSAPLLPLAAVFAISGLCALGGLIGRIPVAGEWIVSLGWGLAFLFGLLIALIVVATAAGWPLMVAAVATENSDAFDGFSRSFSYLYGRPWQFLWCLAVALLVGAFLVTVIDTATVASERVAARTVATGMGSALVSELYAASPKYFATAAARPADRSASPSPVARVVSFWLGLIATIALGVAISYLWTAATIIYFLLRRADDATAFDEVWLTDLDEQDDLLALAGIASTEQTVTERSHHPTVGPPVTTS